jgi:beta-hydroxylase
MPGQLSSWGVFGITALASGAGTALLLALFIMLISIQPRIVTLPFDWAVTASTPRKAFYSEEEMAEIYPEYKELEEKYPLIRAEFEKAVADGYMGKPIQDVDRSQLVINRDSAWKIMLLKAFGENMEDNQKLFPVTTSIIRQSERTLTVFFSILEPGKEIPPHYGYSSNVLRVHLGLIIPEKREDCHITVDGQRYSWTNGKCVMFNDRLQHSVRNDTSETRVVLFIDVKRPLPGKVLPKWSDGILKFVKGSKRLQNAMRKAELQQDV